MLNMPTSEAYITSHLITSWVYYIDGRVSLYLCTGKFLVTGSVKKNASSGSILVENQYTCLYNLYIGLQVSYFDKIVQEF